MNIRDLEYLVAVHDVNSFSKAAERCKVSQPTLSGQLKKLETDLDTPLIERSTRRVIFTAVGETVVEHARNVLTMVGQIQSLAKTDDEPMSGDIHVGLLPTIGPFLLPMLMPELTKQYPKVNLYLYELQAEKLLEKLLKGELDAAVLTKQQWSKPVNEIALYTEKLLLAVSCDNKLSEQTDGVTCSAIKSSPVLMLEDEHCLQEKIMSFCNAVGTKETQRYKATSINTLLHMVTSNKGITLMPELACNESLSGVKFLPFKNTKPRRDIVMLTRKGSSRQETLKVLAQTISTTVNEINQST